MNTCYARIICGSFLDAKKMLVLELEEALKEKGTSPEKLTEIFRKFGWQGPSVSQIIEDPILLTGRFICGEHILGLTLDGSWEDWNTEVRLFGKYIRVLIKKYLDEMPGAIENAVREFQAKTRKINVRPNLAEQCESLLEGKSPKSGAINSVPPSVWAEAHIYICILKELDSFFAF